MKKGIHKFLNLLLPSNCRSHDFKLVLHTHKYNMRDCP